MSIGLFQEAEITTNPPKEKVVAPSRKEDADVIFDMLDALRSPIITHGTSWNDTIPQRLFDQVPIARLKNVMLGIQRASYVEVVICMWNRVMEAPLPHEWYNIYMHVSCTVCQEYFNEDHWDELQAPRKLSDYEGKHFLIPLQNWIYKKRREALKSRIRAEEQTEETVIIKEECEQLKIF